MTVKPVNEEDIYIVKEAILFPYVLDVLEHDIRRLMTSELKMKEVYARLLRKAQNDTTASYYEVKKQMRTKGIKLLEETRGEKSMTTQYLCRGYTQNFEMLYSRLKIEVQIRLAECLKVDMTDKKTDP